MKKTGIEALLAVDPNTVSAPALKAALEQHRKEQEEQQAKQALEYLRNVEYHVERSVRALREIRERERAAKAKLEKIVAARDEFHKTGDFNKFSTTVASL